MIKILDERVKRNQCDIEVLYPNCKYLLLMESITDEDGYLYAISTDDKEHSEFCNFWHSIVDKECKFRDLNCVLCGSYKTPDIASPLCEVRRKI